jgi:catechol 2,3-dioxygenase-like lactoylglutathione lyase family enzyme
MKLKNLRPMLWTSDLKGSIDFYTTVLGFRCDEFNDDWGWASLSRDDVEIMFARPNEHEPFDCAKFTGSFYINTDEVDALWEQLKDRVKVCYGIENFDYGMREFAIYDNNGYLIQFGQEIPPH